MNQNESNAKTKLLRFVWTLFPWVIVVVLIAFSIVMISKVREKSATLEEAQKASMRQDLQAINVITLSIRPSDLEDKINLPAVVEPFENLWVKAEVSGQVKAIPVKEGEVVEEGQVLVELDDRDYVTRLEQIEANYKLAILDNDRIVALAEKKIAAETELDQVTARVTQLSAQLKEAKLALSRTKITAPISGRLNEIEAKVGDWMGIEKRVAQILQFDEVKVTVGVPESDVSAVLDLNEADIIIEALDNRRVKGKKIFLSRQPSTLARLYDLELIVKNPDDSILPGMFARVELVKEVFKEAIAIPLYAVISQNDENYVFVEKNNKAEKRPVELGILSGWQIQIKSGLAPGDKVIVVGHRQLDEGRSVEVIQEVSDAEEII